MTFWVAGAAVVGAVGGAIISSKATGKAADTQAASTAAANAEQARQFDKLQANQQPYLTSGKAALRQYNSLLGISTPGGFDAPGSQLVLQGDGSYAPPAPAAVDRAALRAQLLPQYTRSTPGSQGTISSFGENEGAGSTVGSTSSTTTVDEAALNAAIEQRAAAAEQTQQTQRQVQATQQAQQQREQEATSPEFGSYARPLTAAEVQLDPGYQFGLTEGQKAIDRKTAAAGGRISGAALKSAAQYGTDYATTGYSTAYNRTNQARTDRLNRLAALAGIGQTATQQVGQAGMNTAQIMGGNTTAQGTATAAGQIAQGNIWAGAGNQIAALYGRNAGAPTQANNPGTYTAPGGGDFYYGTGQNWGV